MTSTQPSTEGNPSKKGAERRRWSRAQAEWPIHVQLDEGTFEARVRDISQAGVCFFLDRPVSEMTRLRIDLEVPVAGGVRRVTGSGAVVRCEKISARLDHYEIAVFLQEIADPDRETIRDYVSERGGV
jgi:hypothetical protein